MNTSSIFKGFQSYLQSINDKWRRQESLLVEACLQNYSRRTSTHLGGHKEAKTSHALQALLAAGKVSVQQEERHQRELQGENHS